MYLSPRLAIVSNDTAPAVIQTDFIPLNEQGVKLQVTNAVLVVLATTWTALRFWCRKMKGAGYFFEDWMHLGAVICFYGTAVANWLGNFFGGAGHHLAELQPWHIVRLSRIAYANQVLYAVSLCLVKMSIVWMLNRIFATPKFAIAAKVVMTFTLAWTILVILMGLLICHPVQMNWNPYTPGGSCGDQVLGFVSVGIVDIVNELCILILPMPMVWRLRMPLRYRAALFCMFGAGILTLLCATVRVYELIHIDYTDVTYTANDATILANVESGVAIIVSCSPILRPLFDRVFGRSSSTDDSPRHKFSLRTFGRSNRERKLRKGGYHHDRRVH
ncbi:hypothetical protein PG996_006734 [Apiospora saccharicola]|uniref:Rhodopsin domain-containing protein n=1 Tax=Apiospora saccharicola TaxID=335842 RepID=A0ABR1V8U0_9PEZI